MIVTLTAAHLTGSPRAPGPAQLALPFPTQGDTPRPVPVTCDICGTRETQRLRFGEAHRACSRCTLEAKRRAHAGPTITLRGPGLQVLGEVPGERRGREVIPHEDRFSDQDRAVWDAYCRLHDEAEARMEFGPHADKPFCGAFGIENANGKRKGGAR